ncbi:hypothetical protein BH20BAC1_BH20BAC1_12000 [soil metagenome]
MITYNPVSFAHCTPWSSSTFGSGGTATVDYGEYEEATSVIVQSDGKILLLGGIIYYPQEEFVDALVRLNKDGTPDNSFGNNGQVIVALNILEANVQKDIALQDDGKIIAGGNTAIRFNTNGTRDNSFGINGIVDNIFLNDLAIFGNKLYTVDGIQVSRYFLQGFNVNIISPSPYTVFDAPGPVQITVDAISPSALIERVETIYF